jgi:hypothetical protein
MQSHVLCLTDIASLGSKFQELLRDYGESVQPLQSVELID